jgi:FAD binding domain
LNSSATIIDDLSRLVGIDIAVAPTPENLVRHTRDYNVEGNPGVGILALTFPRSTGQVSKILRYCNERRIGVQPQGGMTGLAGGGVPIGPCVVIALERMRAIREIDPAQVRSPSRPASSWKRCRRPRTPRTCFIPSIWVAEAPARPAATSPPTPAATACCALAWLATSCSASRPYLPMAPSSTGCAR